MPENRFPCYATRPWWGYCKTGKFCGSNWFFYTEISRATFFGVYNILWGVGSPLRGVTPESPMSWPGPATNMLFLQIYQINYFKYFKCFFSHLFTKFTKLLEVRDRKGCHWWQSVKCDEFHICQLYCLKLHVVHNNFCFWYSEKYQNTLK
jgi:hypothetical protein